MFWRIVVRSTARLNSFEPHIRRPNVTFLGPESSATPLWEPQMLQVSVVLTVCFETHIPCVWCSKGLWGCCLDEISVFSSCSCDNSQHTVVVSCLSAHRCFMLYWMVLCGNHTSECWSWCFFVLYNVLSRSIIFI